MSRYSSIADIAIDYDPPSIVLIAIAAGHEFRRQQWRSFLAAYLEATAAEPRDQSATNLPDCGS